MEFLDWMEERTEVDDELSVGSLDSQEWNFSEDGPLVWRVLSPTRKIPLVVKEEEDEEEVEEEDDGIVVNEATIARWRDLERRGITLHPRALSYLEAGPNRPLASSFSIFGVTEPRPTALISGTFRVTEEPELIELPSRGS